MTEVKNPLIVTGGSGGGGGDVITTQNVSSIGTAPNGSYSIQGFRLISCGPVIAKLDGGKFLVGFVNSSNYYCLVVATLASDNTWSTGTPVQVTTSMPGYTEGPGVVPQLMVLSATSAVLLFLDGSHAVTLYPVAISGSTITLGASDGRAHDNARAIPVDTTRFIYSYYSAGSHLMVNTKNGNAITWGDDYDSIASYSDGLCLLDATHLVVGTYSEVKLVKISGTTLINVSSAPSSNYKYLVKVGNKIIGLKLVSGVIHYAEISVVDDVISVGAEATFNSPVSVSGNNSTFGCRYSEGATVELGDGSVVLALNVVGTPGVIGGYPLGVVGLMIHISNRGKIISVNSFSGIEARFGYASSYYPLAAVDGTRLATMNLCSSGHSYSVEVAKNAVAIFELNGGG